LFETSGSDGKHFHSPQHRNQGCQIFLGAYNTKTGTKCTKWTRNVL
jgi:hypothetical protein